MPNPYFMQAALHGLAENLTNAHKDQLARQQEDELGDRKVFETLLKSGNPEMQRLGLAGLMEKRTKGWFGKLRQSEVMPQVDAVLNRVSKPTTPPAPKPQAAAQVTTSPTEGGSMTLTPGAESNPEGKDLGPPPEMAAAAVEPPPEPTGDYQSRYQAARNRIDPLGFSSPSPMQEKLLNAEALGIPEDRRRELGEQELFPTATRAATTREGWAQKTALTGIQHGYKMDENLAKNQVPVSAADSDRYDLPAGSMIDLRLLQMLHADTRAMDSVAARRYAADMANSHAIQAVFTGKYTTSGTPIMTYVHKNDLPGQEILKTPSATEERVVKQAGRIQIGAAELQEELKNPEITASLGPAMGRITKLSQLVGNPDPQVQEFLAHLQSWMALQPALHGFRGIGAMEHFEKLVGAPITTPEALAAAIRGIDKTAKTFMQEGAAPKMNVGGPPAAPAAPATKKRYNPTTGKIE